MSAPSWWMQPQRPSARLGLKGADAARLLLDCGIAIPDSPNAVTHGDGASLAGLSRCLRLGHSEFLLEEDQHAGAIESIRTQAGAAAMRAWCVLRTDYSALIGGAAVFDQLSRIASFDFRQLLHAPERVVMTLVADISMTLVMEDAIASAPRLRLWADASFGTYLEQTLHSLSTIPPTASSHGEPA
ncbi:MAG TPA: hypothetical protein VN762_06385 [Steroidobacteraceae bacterium]|nr:hypothetical protein [Steroidobacteraceae bacterium]